MGEILGFIVGWLRIFNQFDTAARFGFDGYRTVFAPYLRGLQYFILCGDDTFHADIFRWFSTGAKFRTYARKPLSPQKLQTGHQFFVNFRHLVCLACAKYSLSRIIYAVD